MLTHFSILLLMLLVALIWEKSTRYNKLYALDNDVFYSYKGALLPWLIVFAYISLLAGVRSSGLNDTYAYVLSFNNQTATWEALKECFGGDIKYIGSKALTILFKMFVSSNYHVWFLTWAVIESCLFINVLRRESVSFWDSCFFFFASTLYYNYFSMMRQWMAVAIMFWGSRYLRDGKLLKYLLVCLLAGAFHPSALFMVPLFFIVRSKPWKNQHLLILLCSSIVILCCVPFLSSMDEGTYSYVFDTMSGGNGSSIMRVFIATVPVVLAYLERDRMYEYPMIDVCINMSLINIFLSIFACVTSGLYVTRMATYMAVYNVILYPYLLNATRMKSLKMFFYILYLAFYIYQMGHQQAWGYHSDILLWLNN